MKARIIVSSVLAAVAASSAWGQVGVVAAGGETDGSGTVSYSVGQVVYEPSASAKGSLTPGVQQAYLIVEVLSLDEKRVSLSVSAYPNPTTDRLSLQVEGGESGAMSYDVVSLSGKTLRRGKVSAVTTDIDMASLPVGVYMLIVKEGDRSIKTFKIIKK